MNQTTKPTADQVEDAAIIRDLINTAESKKESIGRIADFLAAHDQELLKPWREAVILAERWFDSSRVTHVRDCAGASPVMKCDCGVRALSEKFGVLLSTPPALAPDERIVQLKKSCGCVTCKCEDEVQCQGCGAKTCREHAPTEKKP